MTSEVYNNTTIPLATANFQAVINTFGDSGTLNLHSNTRYELISMPATSVYLLIQQHRDYRNYDC